MDKRGTLLGLAVATALTGCSDKSSINFSVEQEAVEHYFEKGFGQCDSPHAACGSTGFTAVREQLGELTHASEFSVDSGRVKLGVFHPEGEVPFTQEELDGLVDTMHGLDSLSALSYTPVGKGYMFSGDFEDDDRPSVSFTMGGGFKDPDVYSIVHQGNADEVNEEGLVIYNDPAVVEFCQQMFGVRRGEMYDEGNPFQLAMYQEGLCNRLGMAARAAKEGWSYERYVQGADIRGYVALGPIHLKPLTEEEYQGVWEIYQDDKASTLFEQIELVRSRIRMRYVLDTTPGLDGEQREYLEDVYLPTLVDEGVTSGVRGLRHFVELAEESIYI